MDNAAGVREDVETWHAAEQSALKGDERSANAMRMVALTRMLAAAETAILVGDDDAAASNLVQLQRYASLMAAELSACPAR